MRECRSKTSWARAACAAETTAARVRASALLAAAIVLLHHTGAAAEPGEAGAMASLDEQVQEIKSDVLAIAAELRQLEEQLLFPSNTQVSFFVNLAEDENLELDSLRVQVDGEWVVHHLYSFKELGALQKGGVQRLYTGNFPKGAHNVQVEIAGKLASGAAFSESQSFAFEKAAEPKIMSIEVASRVTGGASIALGDG